jgi:hypothetical protein
LAAAQTNRVFSKTKEWKMKKFIEFNDKLDNSRKHRLEDYIPQVARAISPYRDN